MIITLHAPAASNQWANMPAALTEFDGGTLARVKADLTNFTDARIVANIQVAGLAASELRVQYSTTGAFGGEETYLGSGNDPAVVLTSTGTIAGSWVAIDTAAKTDVWLRVIGIDGDGAADPAFGLITLQLR